MKKKFIFMPFSGENNGKSFFMKEIVYGLEKNGYSVTKLEGNIRHGDFLHSFNDSQLLNYKKLDFFNIFSENENDGICLDLPINYIDTFFETTKENLLDCSTKNYNQLLKTLFRINYSLFFVIPFSSDLNKSSSTLYNLIEKTEKYLPNKNEKINLIIIKNKGLWKLFGKNKETEKEYNNLIVLNELKNNPLFNVIEFDANENFNSISHIIRTHNIENIVNNEVVKSNGIFEGIALEIQEESLRLYQSYRHFL